MIEPVLDLVDLVLEIGNVAPSRADPPLVRFELPIQVRVLEFLDIVLNPINPGSPTTLPPTHPVDLILNLAHTLLETEMLRRDA